jgi:enoyl-CoA hydratase/carnithine racemase
MWRALPAIRAAVEARVLLALVEGEWAHFSAGADIAEFDQVRCDAAATRDMATPSKMASGPDGSRPSDHRGDPRRRGRRWTRPRLHATSGCALPMRTLRSTPAKRGLLHGHAESRRLVELAGPSRAKDLLFTGRGIETEEALAIGLIDRRIETALEEIVLGYARDLAELSQASIRGAKRAVDAVAAGMSVETPGYRALVKWAALAFRGPIAPLERL